MKEWALKLSWDYIKEYETLTENFKEDKKLYFHYIKEAKNQVDIIKQQSEETIQNLKSDNDLLRKNYEEELNIKINEFQKKAQDYIDQNNIDIFFDKSLT